MGENLSQFIIELKNLAKFLRIEEVKEEPHHSTEYYPSKQRGDQLFRGETGLRPRKTFEEEDFLNRQGNAIENARRRGRLL